MNSKNFLLNVITPFVILLHPKNDRMANPAHIRPAPRKNVPCTGFPVKINIAKPQIPDMAPIAKDKTAE